MLTARATCARGTRLAYDTPVVVGMSRAPFLLTVTRHLAVLRVGQHLPTVIPGVGAGTPADCKPFAGDIKQKSETKRGNGDNAGSGSSRLLRR
jgi:hypothetical protein